MARRRSVPSHLPSLCILINLRKPKVSTTLVKETNHCKGHNWAIMRRVVSLGFMPVCGKPCSHACSYNPYIVVVGMCTRLFYSKEHASHHGVHNGAL